MLLHHRPLPLRQGRQACRSEHARAVTLCVYIVSNIALFLALSRGKEEAKGGGDESMYTQQPP